MNQTSKTLVKYFTEIIIVTFGVFLGFYFSNLNAENKLQIEKQKSINFIVSELEYNLELIKSLADYHERIKVEMDKIVSTLSKKDQLSSYLLNDKFKHNEINGWQGFKFAKLQDNAFESAKISGIVKEFDIKTIQKLSYIYTFQNSYIDFGELILNKVFDTNSSTKMIDFIGLIQIMTTDLLSLEKELSNSLENTLIELENHTNK